MVNIQFISLDRTFDCFRTCSFQNAEAFDKFKINIIDFAGGYVWKDGFYELAQQSQINYLTQLFTTSSKNTTLILLPQNITFNEYGQFIDDKKSTIAKVVSKFIQTTFSLKRERNTITIREKQFSSDFYFDSFKDEPKKLLKADMTERTLAFSLNNCIITTLKVDNENDINLLLENLGVIDFEFSMPEWLQDYPVFDEALIKNNIKEHKEKIAKLNELISDSQNKLTGYYKYKQLLYESGENLVRIVKEVLHELTNYDFSVFKDEKKEDLKFEKNEKIYLIEIKGVNKNVMRSHITQISSRRDEYEEDNNISKIKPILIINDQRQLPINQRVDVSDEQIRLAKMYGVLIIKTQTLLTILEDFRDKKILANDFFKMLDAQEGLLVL